MHRNAIRHQLQRYESAWNSGQLGAFRAFVDSTPDCFERTSPQGHVTGSALVVTPDLSQVLLTLHAKLGKWLQLGGHADGDSIIERVALKEVEEESGLKDVHFLEYESWIGQAVDPVIPLPFDIDIHEIPARKVEAAHLHYDIRFLIVAERPEQIELSDESTDLRWLPISEAIRLAPEPSMQRQFEKLNRLRQLS